MLTRHLKAFTLTELLVVLVIIGILVLLALPVLTPMISRTKAMEAQIQLKHLYELERMHFFAHSRYSDDFSKLGFEQAKLIEDGGDARFLIEVVQADQTGFIARATAMEDFDGDGTYNVWEIDQEKRLEEVIPD